MQGREEKSQVVLPQNFTEKFYLWTNKLRMFFMKITGQHLNFFLMDIFPEKQTME